MESLYSDLGVDADPSFSRRSLRECFAVPRSNGLFCVGDGFQPI